MTLEHFAIAVASELKRHDIDVILTGGAVVSIYSTGKYVSKDADFLSATDHKTIAQVMHTLGFKNIGKDFYHDDTDFTVEFPGSQLVIGNSPMKPEGKIKSKHFTLKLLSPTQCVMDRLAAYYTKMISNNNLVWILFASLFSLSTFASEPDRVCVDWFNNAKMATGTKGCEPKCAILTTEMGTFMCPDQCDKLCKPKEKTSLPSKYVFYPGLTQAEKELVVKNPNQAFLVFKQKGLAEDSADRNFPNQNLNDESDAFRHFIWAGLLTKALGREKAKEYLDAHETDPDQPKIEKHMDSFNNGRSQRSVSLKNKCVSESRQGITYLGACSRRKLRRASSGAI
jgi:hypothetical protein